MSPVMRDRAPTARPLTLRGFISYLTATGRVESANRHGVLCKREISSPDRNPLDRLWREVEQRRRTPVPTPYPHSAGNTPAEDIQ